MSRFAILTFSLRASKRLPTTRGNRIDMVQPFDAATEKLLLDKTFISQGTLLSLRKSDVCDAAKFTSVMRAALANIFDEVRLLTDEVSAYVEMDLEGVSGFFRIDHVLLCTSSKDKAGQVEGDDILFIVFLRGSEPRTATQPPPAAPVEKIRERFKTAQALWGFLVKIGLTCGFTPTFSDDYPLGNYVISGDRILENALDSAKLSSWLDGNCGLHARVASSLVCAYLFYSYLLCQRTERLTMSIHVNGNWDVEWRKLILARKKLIVGRQHAFLKNRAQPDSPVLDVYTGCSRIYRLQIQLDNLMSLLDELSKTLEMENAYETGRRVRAIEWIIFLSTILGLGVALNAIQMPPFFEPTTPNALGRWTFWIVFGFVFCMAAIFGCLYAYGQAMTAWLIDFRNWMARWRFCCKRHKGA